LRAGGKQAPRNGGRIVLDAELDHGHGLDLGLRQ
jgi:hypothetical protein